jgi:histidinol-phosphatase (PHP family)
MLGPVLPADDHVHTEWSWDAVAGDMDATCARAVEVGLPAVSFTEHVDLGRWVVPPELLAHAGREPRIGIIDDMASWADEDGTLVPPALDVDGYLACIERCRDRHPGLRIRAGAEVGEPHLFVDEVRRLATRGGFDVVLGSQHTVPFEGRAWPVDSLFGRVDPDELIRTYLAEVLQLVEGSDDFAVLAHIDYPLRRWPVDAGPFDPAAFEDELRTVLRALARSGRALELNTRVPLASAVVGWWREEGGPALTFGSDAHSPDKVGQGLAEATAVAEAAGFAPGPTPVDPWRRA